MRKMNIPHKSIQFNSLGRCATHLKSCWMFNQNEQEKKIEKKIEEVDNSSIFLPPHLYLSLFEFFCGWLKIVSSVDRKLENSMRNGI